MPEVWLRRIAMHTIVYGARNQLAGSVTNLNAGCCFAEYESRRPRLFCVGVFFFTFYILSLKSRLYHKGRRSCLAGFLHRHHREYSIQGPKLSPQSQQLCLCNNTQCIFSIHNTPVNNYTRTFETSQHPEPQQCPPRHSAPPSLVSQ